MVIAYPYSMLIFRVYKGSINLLIRFFGENYERILLVFSRHYPPQIALRVPSQSRTEIYPLHASEYILSHVHLNVFHLPFYFNP